MFDVEHHKRFNERLRACESYAERVLLGIVEQTVDEEIKRRVEHDARNVLAALAGDEKAMRSLLGLVALLRFDTMCFTKRKLKDDQAGRARIQKHLKALEEGLALGDAIEAARKKVKNKPARSDAYANKIRPHVLEALGLPGDAKKPSVRVIRDKIPVR